MLETMFDGQQSDERVLYILRPHPFSKWVTMIAILIAALFFMAFTSLIANTSPALSGFIRLGGMVGSIGFAGIGLFWMQIKFTKSVSYITDRRIMRFEVMTPFFTTKRALFWNEALKAKGYTTNILLKALKIGRVTVEPQAAEGESIVIPDVFLFEDVANYIDKILFTFKNKPADIAAIKPFVPKPKGQRD